MLPQKVRKKAEQLVLWLRRWKKNLSAEVNNSPIWILGNQKSGTTAIASLIASYGKLSKNIDFGEHYATAARQITKIAEGQLSAKEFIRRFRWGFSKDLIKEPHLTFLFDQFDPYLPDAKHIFIVRDPRDNIRSILNRVNLSGIREQNDIANHPAIPLGWKNILLNKGLGYNGDNYIERLAHRWCNAVNVYLQNEDRMLLVKYETFNKNKETTIKRICSQLSISQQHDISSEVDIQYQPSGNHSVGWEEFFGYNNLKIIDTICSSHMKKFGYEIKTDTS